MEEIWTKVPNYNYYEVSNYGRVKSLAKKRWNGFKYVDRAEKILKPRPTKKGYIHYALWNENGRKDLKGHWIVLYSFYGNSENMPMINHKNGIKSDNRLENLEWSNNSLNQRHAFALGLQTRHKGSENPCAKQVNQYDMEGNFIKKWFCISDAVAECKAPHISCCINGRRKSSGGYKWSYVKGK